MTTDDRRNSAAIARPLVRSAKNSRELHTTHTVIAQCATVLSNRRTLDLMKIECSLSKS